MTHYKASPQEHLALAKHLTAEQKVEEFVAGKGIVVRWERKRRQNHWFDALYNACAAEHLCGARLVPEPPRPPRRYYTLEEMKKGAHRRDGTPWIDTELSVGLVQDMLSINAS